MLSSAQNSLIENRSMYMQVCDFHTSGLVLVEFRNKPGNIVYWPVNSRVSFPEHGYIVITIYPLNIVLLFLLAGSMGMALGATCCFFEFDVIVAASLRTASVVDGVTLLTFWLNFDNSKITYILFLLQCEVCCFWIS